MEKIESIFDDYKELLVKDDCLTTFGALVCICFTYGCLLSFFKIYEK